MDVDNSGSDGGGGVGGGGGPIDVEQSLLQQFSCMGTTDRDELIKQLQKLLGSNLNYSTAAFFLDMNNWNLQAAICSYLDIESPNQLPSMALAIDSNATDDHLSFEQNVSFQKQWYIYNNGTEPWPAGCYAQCSDGDSFGCGRVPVPCVQPGEATHLIVTLKSPSKPGIYQSKWRLCTPKGAYFGDHMWLFFTVLEEEGTRQLTQQLSHFSELGASLVSPNIVAHNPFTPQRSQLENNQENAPSDGQDSQMC